MTYEIILSPEPAEDLQQLKANVRATVRAALTTYLRHQPMQVSKSRIKRLRERRHPQYCLPIDEIRVFYDLRGTDVEVLAIVDKSKAQAWLARFGEVKEQPNDETDSIVGSEE